MFTNYWKVLVLNFSVIGNTVFFLSQEVDGKMIFTGYWEVLVLNFSVMWNTVFSQKVEGKMIFTWSFLAFYDIPGPGKYGFSRSESTKVWFLCHFFNQNMKLYEVIKKFLIYLNLMDLTFFVFNLFASFHNIKRITTQPTFTYSELMMETSKQCVKSLRVWHWRHQNNVSDIFLFLYC